MKELKRQARAIVSDLIESHCNPCTKQADMGVKDGAQFGRDYCNVECSVGRDLKKLGEYLETKGDKVVKVKVKKLNPSKENCQDLLAKGTKNKDIAEMFGMSLANFYIKKKEWGLTGERVPKKENKSFGKHLADFVTEKEAAAEIIQPDYSREIEKYETEIAGLKESNKLLSEKLREVEHIQAYNREAHQQNAELKQNLKEKENVILGLFDDYKALQLKYDAVASALKVTL
jgi:transposase